MPEISQFFGIVINMYYEDHLPAHFHAKYSGHRVLIDINTLSVFAGSFPPRALGLVIEWATFRLPFTVSMSILICSVILRQSARF